MLAWSRRIDHGAEARADPAPLVLKPLVLANKLRRRGRTHQRRPAGRALRACAVKPNEPRVARNDRLDGCMLAAVGGDFACTCEAPAGTLFTDKGFGVSRVERKRPPLHLRALVRYRLR